MYEPIGIDRYLAIVGFPDPVEKAMSDLVEIMPRMPDKFDGRLNETIPSFLTTVKRAGMQMPQTLLHKTQEIDSMLPSDEPLLVRLCDVGEPENRATVEERINRIRGVLAFVAPIHGDLCTIAGSPSHGPVACPQDYVAQYAFKQVDGIDVPGAHAYGFTGQGVRVGVFDNSPFGTGVGDTRVSVNVHYDPADATITRPMDITVRRPWYAITLPSLFNQNPFPDHGLCACSLIHHVAPESDIYLISILDKYVQCYALALYCSMLEFIDDTVNAQLEHMTVLNLSLSVKEGSGFPWFLGHAIADAIEKGITIVASAGNESPVGALTNSGPKYPASDLDVIGVQACSAGGYLTPWSNTGDVGAPGSGVVGRVHKPALAPESYEFISGTSFAAPLVTGVAALKIGACAGNATPANMLAALKLGSTVDAASNIALVKGPATLGQPC